MMARTTRSRSSEYAANVTNALYDGGTPVELVSNSLLLRVEPDPNVSYLLWSDKGRCDLETPGGGDDEIWFDAFIGHMIPTAVPAAPDDPVPFDIKTASKKFPREPWEDMDDGESAGTYSVDIFGPGAFELYGTVVVGILGYEVDDEAAAQEQLDNFGDAFWEAMGMVGGWILLVAGAGGGVGVLFEALTLTAGLIILAVVVAVVVIGCIFWAAWAPADLVAMDVFVLDALSAWEKTDPKKPLPAESYLEVGDVAVIHRPLGKLHKENEASATWIEEHQYVAPRPPKPEEIAQLKESVAPWALPMVIESLGPESIYTLEFRLARTS